MHYPTDCGTGTTIPVVLSRDFRDFVDPFNDLSNYKFDDCDFSGGKMHVNFTNDFTTGVPSEYNPLKPE